MAGGGAARMQCTNVVLPSDDELKPDDNEAIDDAEDSDWVEVGGRGNGRRVRGADQFSATTWKCRW